MQIQGTHKNYRFFFSEDGSPSIEIEYPSSLKEKMHSSRGAFSESVYIYGKALSYAAKQFEDLKILSVGLGLGYNELLSACMVLKENKPLSCFSLHSFESENFLVDAFLSLIYEKPLQADFEAAYRWILKACAKEYELPESEILGFLKAAHESQKWEIGGWFQPAALSPNLQWNVLLYDAFSSKISPGLWSESELDVLLKNHCEETCIFSTYAATGNLKRSLKARSFVLQNRPGFAGKRDSTYALRNC